jgi:hypothetical protein
MRFLAPVAGDGCFYIVPAEDVEGLAPGERIYFLVDGNGRVLAAAVNSYDALMPALHWFANAARILDPVIDWLDVPRSHLRIKVLVWCDANGKIVSRCVEVWELQPGRDEQLRGAYPDVERARGAAVGMAPTPEPVQHVDHATDFSPS